MVAEAARDHDGVSFSVTPAFGVHEKLGEIILGRAGIAVNPAFATMDHSRCWDPACSQELCGDACRAKQPETSSEATKATAAPVAG
jgi:hypothetical protein